MTERIKSKDQLKIPGTYNAQETRLEDIEDDILENETKIVDLRKANKELETEAVALAKAMKLKGPRCRGGQEWSLKKSEEKYVHEKAKAKKAAQKAVEEAELEETEKKKESA